MLCFGYCARLCAQATSQISGTVKDASGAVVGSAEITVTQTSTGFTRGATSDANGVYSLPSLPLGPYRLEVKKEGFATYVQTGIVLEVASAPTIDPVLQVGAVSQSVQVEAAVAMVETSSTGVGQVVNSQDVVELPLNGREVTQLITLAGASNTVQYGFGQAPQSGNLVSSKNYPNEALVSVGGGMLNGTTYLLDGGTYNDPFNNLNLPLPFPDAVQEFNVQTSALPAEYGQHSAGAINVVSKSGTNDYHGDAFEFVRNADFNARDYFTKTAAFPNGQSDNLKRNQFGGTLGGPIRKEKLFFFLGYQRTVIRSAPASTPAVVPTPSELEGNFQNYMTPACFGGKTPPTLNPSYFTDNILNYAVPSEVAAFASHFPVGPEPCGFTTYRIIANQNENMGLAKIDYHINSKHSLFGRYFVTHSLIPSSFTGTELSVQNAGTDDMVNSVAVGDTYLFSTNALNTFTFTLNRDGIKKFQVPIVTPTDFGVEGMYTALPSFSNINITGDFQSAGGFATPGLVNTQTYQFADDFNLVRGSHQIQFGFSYIRPSQTSTFCVYCNGLFTFSGTYTGTAMSDFIAGALDSLTQLNVSHDNEYWRYLGIYAQDSWKINSRLTLNYGLRWEPYLNGTFHNHQVSHFIMQDFVNNVHSATFPNAPAGTFYPGDSQFPTGSRPNKTTWTDFAPRVGLAWDPTGSGKTLLRASWGIFYDMPQTLFYYNYSAEPLWGEGVTVIPPQGAGDTFVNPWASYSPTFVSPFPTTQNTTTPYPAAGYYETVPLNVRNTYVEQWNLALQKQMGRSWLLKASYLGNETSHLWMDKELNPAVYIPGTSTGSPGSCGFLTTVPAAGKPCSSTSNTQARRDFTELNPSQGPFYGTTEYLDDSGTASYNALIVSAEHRFANNFSLLANYTYSHCIADAQTSELSAPVYTDPADPRFDRGNCPLIDVHHNINISGVFQSPHFSSRTLQWIAGDWQVAPIIGIHTGSYFNVTMGGVDADTALSGIAGQRPDLVADPYCVPKGTSFPILTDNCWLNPAAFVAPPLATLGNLKANSLLGPGFVEVDGALSRRFPITESQSIEIRAEAFNLANHTNFLNPGTASIAGGTASTTTHSSTFGEILSDVSPRVLQFAIKYVF
ncbi:MAG: carboxypeptidase regulatory-like domain-containing protein [Candidatus Acidiferrales bacterium]